MDGDMAPETIILEWPVSCFILSATDWSIVSNISILTRTRAALLVGEPRLYAKYIFGP